MTERCLKGGADMKYIVICARIDEVGEYDGVEDIYVCTGYDRAKKHRDFLLSHYPKDEVKVSIHSEESLVKALGVIY